jgi:hypothetical protein
MIIYSWKVDLVARPWRPPLTWASDGGKRRSLCVVRFHGNIMRCHYEGGPRPQIVIYWLKGCEGVIWSSERAPLRGWVLLMLMSTCMDAACLNNHSAAKGKCFRAIMNRMWREKHARSIDEYFCELVYILFDKPATWRVKRAGNCLDCICIDH